MENTLKLIEKLIKSTFDNRIQWRLLREVHGGNRQISKYISRNMETILTINMDTIFDITAHINVDNSYVVNYSNGYIFLITKKLIDNQEKLFYYLAIQKNESSEIIELNTANEYQIELIRLCNSVNGQLGNLNEFITGFLNDPSI